MRVKANAQTETGRVMPELGQGQTRSGRIKIRTGYFLQGGGKGKAKQG